MSGCVTTVDRTGLGAAVDPLLGALARRFGERLVDAGEDGYPLALALDREMGEDRYALFADADGARVTAGSVSGLFAGAGDFLQRSQYDGRGGFSAFQGSASLCPVRPFRGIYFATHFFNYYQVAPLEELFVLLEDLALKGCNALMLWYDMHQYAGPDDAAAREMASRIARLFGEAHRLGMKTVLLGMANEAYAGTPDAIKAHWLPEHGYHTEPRGHYHVEICPSEPGGLDEIVRQRREMLDALQRAQFDYFCLWPYDQGGCTCKECAPWGSRGLMKILPEVRQLLAEMAPNAKLICSTWHFDHFVDGEWSGFRTWLGEHPNAGVDYLMGYFWGDKDVPVRIQEEGMPQAKHMIAFPEISMYGCMPWGGFGSNATPALFQRFLDQTIHLYEGGSIPYSEGIYEDINKAMMLNAFSGRNTDMHDVVREYARFEFCADDATAERVVALVDLLEALLPRHRITRSGEVWDHIYAVDQAERDHCRFVLDHPDGAQQAKSLAEAINESLAPVMRSQWRWRILYLRALADAALVAADGWIDDQCEACLQELECIYHADEAFYVVAPPTRAAVHTQRGGQL